MRAVAAITTHVLDTAGPARRRRGGRARGPRRGGWEPVGAGLTDEQGRLSDLLPEGAEPMAATYRMRFDTGAYFDQRGVETFFPAVTVEFTLREPGEHHHVPLLLSPFGYSTYRGS